MIPSIFVLAMKQVGNAVIGNSRIAAIVDGLHDLDFREFLERFGNPAHALINVLLFRNQDDRDLSLALQYLRHTLGAFLAGAEIIRSDKQHAFGVRGVGVHGNHRNANRDSCIDSVVK